jgi:hypothetical protein
MAPRKHTKASTATAAAAIAASKVSPSATVKPKWASKKACITVAPLATLQKTWNVQVKELTSVKNTSNAYGGHLDRGVRFLASMIEDR